MNETDWITELYLKRKSLNSTVSILITNDPMRSKELVRRLFRGGFFSDQEHGERIILFDQFTGLSEVIAVRADGAFSYRKIELRPDAQRLAPTTPLSYIDEQVKGQTPANVIFTGLLPENPQGGTLYDGAFLSWSSDALVHKARSSIIVFIHDEELVNAAVVAQCNLLHIPTSTPEERAHLVKTVRDRYRERNGCGDLKNWDDKRVQQIVDATGGLNKTQVESCLLESILRHCTFDLDTIATFKSEIISKKGTLEIELEPQHGFEAVGGYNYLKNYFTNRIVKITKYSDRAKALGLRYPRGYILFGMAGTGKTWIAKALAKELAMPFIELKLSNIKRSLVGESEQRLRDALRTIDENSPALVFIDEIDRLGRRGAGKEIDGGTTRELFSELLSWLGDAKRQSIVIGTTNMPEALDRAFCRVGRFDGLVPQFLPTCEARRTIFKVHTEVVTEVPLAGDVDFESLAQQTELWNGAEIAELVQRASFVAFNNDVTEVARIHFEKALESFVINLDERRKEQKHYVELARQFTNDKLFLEEAIAEIKETITVPERGDLL